jgi:hypothetical protein
VITGTIDTSGNIVEDARSFRDNETAYIAAAVLQGLAFLLLAPVLAYLFDVTVYRRPELPAWGRQLAVAGAVVMAITTVGAGFTTLAS